VSLYSKPQGKTLAVAEMLAVAGAVFIYILVVTMDNHIEIVIKELMSALMAEYLDKERYQKIYDDLKGITQFFRGVVHVDGVPDEDYDFKNGGLSIFELTTYIAGQIKTGVNSREVANLIYELEKSGIIIRENPSFGSSKPINREDTARFKITAKGFHLGRHGLVENRILGFPYIIKKYEQCLVKVLGVKSGDHTIGTGFIVNVDNKLKIITCKHNVEGISNLKFSFDDNTIEKFKIQYHPDDNVDCVIVDTDLPAQLAFYFDEETHPLENVITMGFPTIPRTDDAYLMVHKGEVNGIVKDYQFGQEYIIFSAKTSSGNSGSPLISESGAVVGIVTNEFFEEGQFIKKGKLPYYSAIPVKSILGIYSDKKVAD
jgi:S1-C subfamily serine protease